MVDAALLAHVLTEEQRLRVLDEEIREGAVDLDGEVARLVVLGERPVVGLLPALRVGEARGLGGDGGRATRGERREHLGGVGELGPADGLLGEGRDARPHVLV
ncbi:MAG: hypothetical protein ACK559_32350, partial [bacterium]